MHLAELARMYTGFGATAADEAAVEHGDETVALIMAELEKILSPEEFQEFKRSLSERPYDPDVARSSF